MLPKSRPDADGRGNRQGGWGRRRAVLKRLAATATAAAVVVAVGAGACGSSPEGRRTTAGEGPSRDPAVRYQGDVEVLESPKHGPQLCLGGQLDSLPPQCGGPDVVGWDWAAVGNEESVNGTTWGVYHVVGTFDPAAKRFTLAEPAKSAVGQSRPPAAPDFRRACDSPTGTPPAPQIEEEIPYGAVRDHLVSQWWSDTGTDAAAFNVAVRPGYRDKAEAAVRRVYRGPLCVVERDAPTEAELRRIQSEVFADHEHWGAVSGGVMGTDSFVTVQVAVAYEDLIAEARQRWGDKVELVGILQPVG